MTCHRQHGTQCVRNVTSTLGKHVPVTLPRCQQYGRRNAPDRAACKSRASNRTWQSSVRSRRSSAPIAAYRACTARASSASASSWLSPRSALTRPECPTRSRVRHRSAPSVAGTAPAGPPADRRPPGASRSNGQSTTVSARSRTSVERCEKHGAGCTRVCPACSGIFAVPGVTYTLRARVGGLRRRG